MEEKDYIPIFIQDDNKAFEWEHSADKLKESLLSGISEMNITDEEMTAMIKKYGIEHICQKVVQAFNDLTRVGLDNVEFITNLSRRSLRAFARFKNGKMSVDIDNYLTEEIHSFFVLIYLWADLLYQESVSETEYYEGDVTFAQMNDVYFKYIFTKYYALIKDNNRCDIYTLKYVIKEYEKIGTKSVFNLAVCCEQCAKYFLVAHECAHIYFQRAKIVFPNSDKIKAAEQEEFLADKIAFDIINHIISEEEKGNIDGERVMYPYTYKAPVMLLGFYYLYFVVLSLFDKSAEPLKMIDYVKKRILSLKNYIPECKFDYDLTEGDNAYDALNDTIDTFLEIFYIYRDDGRLNEIIELLENSKR